MSGGFFYMSCMKEMQKCLFPFVTPSTPNPVVTSTGSPLCVEYFSMLFFEELTSGLSV